MPVHILTGYGCLSGDMLHDDGELRRKQDVSSRKDTFLGLKNVSKLQKRPCPKRREKLFSRLFLVISLKCKKEHTFFKIPLAKKNRLRYG